MTEIEHKVSDKRKQTMSKYFNGYYGDNREQIIQACREYKQTEQGKKNERERMKRRYAKDPAKFACRSKLQYAIKTGKVQRQPCFCGEKAEAHHEDYSKPLEVMWLCGKHHREHEGRNHVRN